MNKTKKALKFLSLVGLTQTTAFSQERVHNHQAREAIKEVALKYSECDTAIIMGTTDEKYYQNVTRDLAGILKESMEAGSCKDSIDLSLCLEEALFSDNTRKELNFFTAEGLSNARLGGLKGDIPSHCDPLD